MDKKTKSIAIVVVLAAVVAGGIYFGQRSPQASPASEPQPASDQPAAQNSDPTPAPPTATSPLRAQEKPETPAEKPAQTPAKKESPAPAPAAVKFTSGKCIAGPAGAPLKIEVFSDYECPACRRYYLETVRPLLADYALPGRACVVYYEFPLQMHKHARQAARYGHAASMLGTEKWIQVTDALYYYQANWAANGQIDSVLAQVLSGDEMAKVTAWAGDPRMDELIDGDVALGRSRGVTGTPTTFVSVSGKTEKLPTGIIQYPIFRRYLDNLLAQAQ